MRLYDLLGWLDPSQICYCDTDSVMFIYTNNITSHNLPSNDAIDLSRNVKVGLGLSEWESEMEEGEFITELVAGGPNSYACKTNMKRKNKLGNITVDKDGIAIYKKCNQTKRCNNGCR